MKILLASILILISLSVTAEEIRVWVSNEEISKFPKDMDVQILLEKGYEPHPCGWVKNIQSKILPPPNNKKFIDGTEKVFEFDKDGGIINQWAMPVDSYVYAVSGNAIIVRKGAGALKITNSGVLSSSTQVYVQPKVAECPVSIKTMYGKSSYVRCTEHIDILQTSTIWSKNTIIFGHFY